MATITTLKSGDYTDTTVFSTGTIPVDGDKVTISKLGTATSRVTSSSIGAGSGSVPVTAGTGTGLIGEVIEFDSRPGEYYELTTGFTASAGTAVVTPVLAGAIASGATLRNRGHKVKLLGTRVAGDDTATGVTVNGVLYWDRAANSSLQVKGTYTVNGTEDRGTVVSPLTAVNATLLLNYSAAMALGKYGATYNAGSRCKHYGKTRTRRTTLNGAASGGATTFAVVDAAGWADGDLLLIFPTATGSATTVLEERTIAVGGVSGNTITITAGLTNSKLTGAYVANLTSNVSTDDTNPSFGSSGVTFSASSGGLLYDKDLFHSQWTMRVTDFRVTMSASATSGAGQVSQWRATSSTFTGYSTFHTVSLSNSGSGPNELYSSVVYNANNTSNTSYSLFVSGSKVDSCTIASRRAKAGEFGINSQNPTRAGDMTNCLLYSFSPGGQALGFRSTVGRFASNTVMAGASTGAGGQAPISMVAPGIVIESMDTAPFGMLSTSASVSWSDQNGATTLRNTIFGTAPNPTYGANPGSRITSLFGSYYGGAAGQHEIWDNEGYSVSDTSTRLNGEASFKVVNRTANPFTYTFTSAIPNGATRRVLCNVRRNATYAAGAMPSVTLSIPGVASVSSAVTDVADTWVKTDLSITNTTGSAREITVTLSANGVANASSGAWFDGMTIYPFVQIVRHYGFVFDESEPFRVVNPATVASEATAAAYTGVTVNTATPSITVGAGTTDTWQKLYDGHQAWGVANLAQTVLLTSADGQTFSLPPTCRLSWPAMPGDKTLAGGWLRLSAPGTHSYRLSGTKIEFQTAGAYNMSDTVFSGTVEFVNTSGGAVTVNVPVGTSYTNTGPSITVATPVATQSVTVNGLRSGSRVQIWDTTSSTELANGVSTTSFAWTDSAPASAVRAIRLRVTYVNGLDASLPLEVTGFTCGTTPADAAVVFSVTQRDDTIYEANGIDGSTCTEFTADYPNLQIDANDADGVTTVQRVYAWSRWANTAADGIRLMHDAVQAQDSANYLIDTSVVNARFDNNSATPLLIVGGYIRRSDGTTIIAEGAIQLDPGRAYVAAGGAAITVPDGERVVTLANGSYLARG